MERKALRRLQTMLTEPPTSTAETNRWRDLEHNPFEVTTQGSGGRSGPSPADEVALQGFRQERDTDTNEHASQEPDETNEESSVKETTSQSSASTPTADGPASGNQRAEVAAFQAAVSEAQKKAEVQLRAALDRVRQEEVKKHDAEVARLRTELEKQHADDLQRARSAVIDSFNALTGSIADTAGAGS